MWVSGFHLAQTLAVMVFLLGLVLAAFEGLPPDTASLIRVTREFIDWNFDWLMIAVTGSATLGALFVIVPAVFWRLRPAPREALGMSWPRPRQLVLLAGAVLPLGILSDELYRAATVWTQHVGGWLVANWPVLSEFGGQFDTITLIQQQSESTAYPLLLVIVGLGPAIGEEVVFRGLIGRGLIARWGVVGGVLLTSLLFAAAHVSPAHAVATLPIAVFLHVAYLATGSIGAPIFVHFLNNALSVTMLKYSLGQHVQVPFVLLTTAAVSVAVTAALLLRERPAAGGVPPARRLTSPSTLPPTDSASAVSATPRWLVIAAGSGVLGFTCTFVVAAGG
jgi:membrane protease YdiL (CAAX protease family)